MLCPPRQVFHGGGVIGLHGVPVLVTGAGGFIGSRLVEQLIDAGAQVKVLLRSGIQFERFEHLGCRPLRGDITLPETLPPAVEGCQLVFHCAFGGGDLEESRRVNVEGTLNLLRAAKASGTRRVVHVSSVAVHGTRLPAVVHESQPYVTDGSPYEVSKAEGERAALGFGGENGLEVVVIRPTLVYGPGSQTWTLKLVQRVKYDRVILVAGGTGITNVVYVDDVTWAMMLAAVAPGVAGEAFFISGAGIVTWHEFLGRYAQMCGKPLPPSLPLWLAKLEFQRGLWGYRLIRRPMRITPFDLQAHVQRAVFSIEKAQRVLGYKPQVSLNEGMRRTEEWLHRAGYLLRRWIE